MLFEGIPSAEAMPACVSRVAVAVRASTALDGTNFARTCPSRKYADLQQRIVEWVCACPECSKGAPSSSPTVFNVLQHPFHSSTLFKFPRNFIEAWQKPHRVFM
jgi:hypothetical protein